MSWGNKAVVMLGILFMLILAFLQPFVWQWLYPVYYADEIRKNAMRYNHDPNLLLAIIQTESNFRWTKVSSKGAIGLMQIMEDTANWVIDQSGYGEDVRQSLAHPTVNIAIGSWYLRYLLEQYDQNLVVALAAYNAGPGNVNRWLASGKWDGTLSMLHKIPFGETRHYIQRVLYTYERYGKIYTDHYWYRNTAARAVGYIK